MGSLARVSSSPDGLNESLRPIYHFSFPSGDICGLLIVVLVL